MVLSLAVVGLVSTSLTDGSNRSCAALRPWMLDAVWVHLFGHVLMRLDSFRSFGPALCGGHYGSLFCCRSVVCLNGTCAYLYVLPSAVAYLVQGFLLEAFSVLGCLRTYRLPRALSTDLRS